MILKAVTFLCKAISTSWYATSKGIQIILNGFTKTI